MRKNLTLFLALTTAVLAVVCVLQVQKLREQQMRLATLQSHEQEMIDHIRGLEEGQQRAADQRNSLLEKRNMSRP